MPTAIVGIGHIGGTLARQLVAAGEPVVVAAKDEAAAQAFAREELGALASAASVENAITAADVVVLAVWLDAMRELLATYAKLLVGKIVVDPSNPMAYDADGRMTRTLPEDQSAGSLVAAALPPGARYVKAFGTLGADSLDEGADREPRTVLFYATDDEQAARAVERLIRACGFEPLRIGGVADTGRLEAPGGDLHQITLGGRLLDLDEARDAVAAVEPESHANA